MHWLSVICVGFAVIGLHVVKSADESDSLPESKRCGWQNFDDRYNLENSTALDEYPWLVQLKVFVKVSDTHTTVTYPCTGSLINRRYVLTNANCLKHDKWELISVRLGENDPRSDKDCIPDPNVPECSLDVVDVDIEEAIPHPDFNTYTYENDIGLIRLKELVNFTDYVRPICLPSTDKFPEVGTKLKASGWGNFQAEGDVYVLTNAKKHSESIIVSNNDCQRSYHENEATRKVIVTDNQFCVKENSSSKQSTCLGDRGGPLMFAGEPRQWYQVGIISFGPVQKHEVQCKEKAIHMHTRVTKYIDWIKSNLKP